MRKSTYKQNKETFEKLLEERELILWGKTDDAFEICKKYKVKYIIDSDDEFCDVEINGIRVYTPDKLYCEDSNNTIIFICTQEKYIKVIIESIYKMGDFPIFSYNVMNNC